MYYVENKQSSVAACCDLPGDGFFVGVRVGGHHHRVEDTIMMQSVGDALVVGNAGLCASYFSKTAEIRIFGISKIAEIRIFSIPKTAEIRIFGKIICLIN